MVAGASRWQDAYALRAKTARRGFEAVNQPIDIIGPREVAKANFRVNIGKDALDSAPAISRTGEKNSPLDTMADIAGTPVIKQVLDALSVGGYVTSNIANNMIDVSEGKDNILGATFGGIGEGLAAGVGIDKGDSQVHSYSEIIRRMQEKQGGDNVDSSADKWAQGLGGFAADVALDPLTYTTLGVSPLIKGAVKGAKMGTKGAARKIEEAVAEADEVGADAIRNDPRNKTYSNVGEGIVKGAANERRLWKEERAADKARRRSRKGRNDDLDTNYSAHLGDRVEDMVDGEKSRQFEDAANERGFNVSPVQPTALADIISRITAAPEPKVDVEKVVKQEPKNVSEEVNKALEDVIDDEPVIKPVEPEVKTEAQRLREIQDDFPWAYEAPKYKNVKDIEAFRTANPETIKVAGEATAAAKPAEKRIKPDREALINHFATQSVLGTTNGMKNGGIVKGLRSGNKEQVIGIYRKLGPDFLKNFDLNAVENAVEDIIPSNGMVDAPNPARWTPETLVEKFGVDPADAQLSTQELASLKKLVSGKNVPAIRQTIKANRLSKEQMDILKEVTGEDTIAKIQDVLIQKFRDNDEAIKESRKAAKAKAAAEAKAESKRAVDKPDVAMAKDDVARIMEAINKAPNAFDEVTAAENRVANYENIRAETLAKEDARIPANEVVAAADRVFEAAIERQMKDAPMETNKGYKTLTADIDSGGAWKPQKWTTLSQIAIHNSAMDEAARIVGKGRNYSTKFRAYKEILRLADAKLRAGGIEPYMNIASSVGKGTVNLSLYDVVQHLPADRLSSMLAGDKPYRTFATQIMAMTETFVRGLDNNVPTNELRERMLAYFTEHKIKDLPKSTQAGHLKAIDFRINGLMERNKGMTRAQAVAEIRKHSEKLVDAMFANDAKIYRALKLQSLVNHTNHASRVGKRIEDLTANQVNLLKAQPDHKAFVATMKAANADLRKQFTDDAEYALAKQRLDQKLAELIPANERALIPVHESIMRESGSTDKAAIDSFLDKADELDAKGNPNHYGFGAANKRRVAPEPNRIKINKANVRTTKIAKQIVAEMPKPKDTEYYQIVNAEIAADTAKRLNPMQRLFNPKVNIDEDTYRAINSGYHSVAHQQAQFHGAVLRHIKDHHSKTLTADFKALQAARPNSFGIIEYATKSQQDLDSVISTILSTSAENVFTRGGVGAAHFNALADAQGFNKAWRFSESATPAQNSQLWRSWEGIAETPESVMDFLSKMHGITVRASQDIAIAANFSHTFGHVNPGPGLVKLRRTDKTKSEGGFYDLIDRTLYYDKSIANEIITVDRMMKESRSLDVSKPFGKLMVNVVDPVTNALKASMTTVRPGHWIVSLIGDFLRNQLMGVNSLKPYALNAKVMRAVGQELEGLGPMERFSRTNQVAKGFDFKSGEQNISLNIGGRNRAVSFESVGKFFERVIYLPPHRSGGVQEDLFTQDATTRFAAGVQKATDAVVDNKHLSLNAWAARRDNLMRGAAALDFMMKRKWKDEKEMRDATEAFISKWAPVSTDFTAFEAKYARRTMLFYTWLRGITPRVIETALNKPGLTTVMPKALYNAAQANGLDPMSVGNPFPEEGMFPDYYYNAVLGPQWRDDKGLWGINPSSPVIEVLNTFKGIDASKPGESAMGVASALGGMANPFIRIPSDLAHGTTSGGIPIENNAQYLLDNLGGSWLSTASRASGLTLGEGGIVERTDAEKRTPEQQMEHAKNQLFNFLTGLKKTNYESPEAQRSAAWQAKEYLESQR